MADPQLYKLETNVADNKRYVDNLLAAYARARTERQKASIAAALAKKQDRLAEYQRRLNAWHVAHPATTPVVLIDIGPDPLPNNAQPSADTFGCSDPSYAATYEARTGVSIQTAFNRIVTALLRPHPGADQGAANKQAHFVDYFAGRIPFSHVAGDFGGWYQFLGCDGVRTDLIHDLGA